MLAAIARGLEGAGFNVVAQTSDPHTLVELVQYGQPDLAVVGTDRARLEDQQLYVALRAVWGSVKVVVYGPDDQTAALKSMESGADAFVTKAAPIEDLVIAVRQVSTRSIYLRNPDSSRRHATAGDSAQRFPELTAREHEILRLAATGTTNAEIAESAGVGLQTVNSISATSTRSFA